MVRSSLMLQGQDMPTTYEWNLKYKFISSTDIFSKPHYKRLKKQGLLSKVEGKVVSLVKDACVVYCSVQSDPCLHGLAVRQGRLFRLNAHRKIIWKRDIVRVPNICVKAVVKSTFDKSVTFFFSRIDLKRSVSCFVGERGVRDREDEDPPSHGKIVPNMQNASAVFGGTWICDSFPGSHPLGCWAYFFNVQVWLTRMDGHMGLANSLALNVAGISNNTVDTEGGSVVRNSVGEPTGLLIDSAMTHVLSCIPEVSVEERREALLRASDHALMRGVTTVVDFGRYFPGASPELSWEDLSDVYRWADLSGKMKIRVCLYFPMETWPRLHELIKQAGRKLSQWIYLGGMKSFADGSLGSNSALFHEPYVDEPSNHGLQVADTDMLYNMTLSSDKAGLQVAIHAIGDRANDLILDLYKSVASKNGVRDRRFRIEHAQHLAPGTAARFGEQEVVASVQGGHMHVLGSEISVPKKIGVVAHGGSYLFHSLLAGNAQLALGSDWPVADINPLGSIKTAMKRVPPGWENAWISSECINLNDALNGYTISAARACFLDEDVGSLSPGKMADFVILSMDSWDKFLKKILLLSLLKLYVGSILAWKSHVGLIDLKIFCR
ncbi:hypothetical protein DH2020_023644 [Rehmannia glutinosa]|uniref:Amidohydrolase 3 domain-containing protein n=1 Tax=Rehmannia glutinosa TaxID=99300 RepID=A0ABR0W9I7_REHGL